MILKYIFRLKKRKAGSACAARFLSLCRRGGTGKAPSLARCPAVVFNQPVYAVSKYLELEAFFPSAVVAKT